MKDRNMDERKEKSAKKDSEDSHKGLPHVSKITK